MSAKLGNLSADAYGIALPRDIAKELQDASLVEWVAGNQWTGTIYGLTDAGRAALAAARAGDRRQDGGGRDA